MVLGILDYIRKLPESRPPSPASWSSSHTGTGFTVATKDTSPGLGSLLKSPAGGLLELHVRED